MIFNEKSQTRLELALDLICTVIVHCIDLNPQEVQYGVWFLDTLLFISLHNDFPCLENKGKNRANLESLSIILCLIYLIPEPPLTARDVPCLSAPRKLFCCSCPIIWFIELMFVPLTKPYPLPTFSMPLYRFSVGITMDFSYLCAQWWSLFSHFFHNSVYKAPPCLTNLHCHYCWANPYYSYSYFYISCSQFNHLEQVRIPAVSKAIKENMFDLLSNKVIACLSSVFFVILM